MNTARFLCEEGGRKTEGDMEALAVQDLKRGLQPEQFLSKPEVRHDGNFDLVVKDAEGNLKHIVVSNTDPGCKQIHKLFKAGNGKPVIQIQIGQHNYRLITMDDGAA